MKNIKEYLKSDDDTITLYHKNGEKAVYYDKNSDGYWRESTYDSNNNESTFKDSDGMERGFDIEEMTMEQVCKALGKTIKITK